MRQEVEAEVAELELQQVRQARADFDAQASEHKRQEKETQAADIAARKAEAAAREEARARARAEEADRRRREELEDAERRRRQEAVAERRRILQRAKDGAIAGSPYGIPGDLRASALRAIEIELGSLALDEMPFTEVCTLAAGARDRVYRPHLEAERRAAEEKRAAQQRESQAALDKARRELEAWSKKQGLVRRGLEYADRELQEEDLLERYRVRPLVQSALERTLNGQESEEEAEDLVDDILDRELG